MMTPAFAAFVLVALVTASLAHEATHWVVARALGAKTRFHPIQLHVDVGLTPDREHLRRIINLAPSLVGAVSGVSAFLLTGWPTSRIGVVLALAWANYTLLGGLADYSVRISRGEDWWLSRRSDLERHLMIALAALLAGYAGLYHLLPLPHALAVVGEWVGMMGILFAIGTFAVALEQHPAGTR